ncbi:hypothetical protein [Bradyrhizobium sp. McL0615]|uniref:hypothetical protein n=1 Tax=Bradyrhizobium sp. McL0615 TaxID=3415673 RepID=UPI003CEC10EA
MRPVKTTFPAFSSGDAVQTEHFRTILRKSSSAGPFNDKFFEMIDKRRGELGQLQRAIFFLQLPTFVYLVLLLTGTDVNLNLFGITAGKNLREAFILISSALGLWVTWIGHHKGVLGNMLRSNNDRLAKGDAQKATFLNFAYGLDFSFLVGPNHPDWNLSRWHLIWASLFVIALLALLALFVTGVGAVHIMTLLEVYRHPNFSPLASGITIIFVALTDIITASSFALTSGVLPYRSSENLARLSRIRETNPEKWDQLITSAVMNHRKKGFFRRILGRPIIRLDP